ncbi:MAG: putative manganese-dependent inorganic diphosphatase, partial [Oscillospiraceae bacterium]
PIVNHEEKLLGLITVKVIATSYMDIYDNNILALSKTPYTNILKTLDGEMVVGDSEDFVENGNIIIAAANPDVLENVIKKGDIVILGNRYEAQLCSIEMEAGTLIVCMDAIVSKTIKALAKARGCRIIKTPYDTYMAARLISQSAPISYFMKKEGLVSFNLNTSVDSASAVMASERHRYFPVLDMDGNYFAMLSRRNLLNKKPKQLILVDHNEKTQAANGIEEAEILEIVDHHRIGNLETASPVFFRNYPLGSTCTIIAQLYKEKGKAPDKKTAGLLAAAIISDTLMFRSPTCTKTDIEAAQELSLIAEIDINKFSDAMFYAGSDIKN